MTGSKKPLVREVNPHLICVLCSGYFIEATTIVECLHSFCRSCLIKYLENNKFCPICDVQLHKNNPLLSVRCDPVLQQLVYKLVPGLYSKEMARRRKYYSELGGPSSDSDSVEYPIPDAYFSPSDCISLSLEFLSNNKEGENGSDSEHECSEKQGLHHRRYLQCPAAVTMSHLKKFLRMKYDLGMDYSVEILYAGEVLTDEFSLMDVAYTFSWNKTSPMRFQFRLLQREKVPKANPRQRTITPVPSKKSNDLGVVQEKPKVPEDDEEPVHKQEVVKRQPQESQIKNHVSEPDEQLKQAEEDEEEEEEEEDEENNHRIEEEEEEERNQELEEEEVNERLEEVDEDEEEEEEEEQRMEDEEAMERLEEDEENQRLQEEALIEEETIEEVEDDEDVQIIQEETPPQREELPKRINGLKRPASEIKERSRQEIEPKKAKHSPSPKLEIMKFKQDEKRFIEDMIVEEDTDEDRLRISASEGEKSPNPEPEVEKRVEEKPRSEERRRERKKNKKGKHHHHHRHHDRKRGESPPTAQIVHSPENDIMKLKVKLTAIKSDNMVKGYSVVDGPDCRKESRDNGSSYKNSERSSEKHEKSKAKEEDYKKQEPVSCNNNNNNNNNNSNHNNNNNHNSHSNGNNQINNSALSSNNISEITRRADLKERLMPIRAFRKALPKQNGTVKPAEPLKMPPSSITVSKITAAEKRQMEQQKLLMNRNQINGLDPKRPSLEIMLVNAPKKAELENGKPEVKKVIRPTPPSIPLSRLPKGLVGGPKSSPPPLRAVRPGPEEALDLSGKSSRKSPERLDSLMIPILPKGPSPYAAPARPCKPNQTVRQIPNPSALLFRQNPLNNRSMPPPVVPISSLRQIETMTKKIEKVAAGLSVKAAAAGFAK